VGRGVFNLLAWCWNPPMVVVTVQGAPKVMGSNPYIGIVLYKIDYLKNKMNNIDEIRSLLEIR
jgi:hypothetical protein